MSACRCQGGRLDKTCGKLASCTDSSWTRSSEIPPDFTRIVVQAAISYDKARRHPTTDASGLLFER